MSMTEKRSPHTQCRDCDQPITWMKTQSGKNIAVDRDSLPLDWDEFDIFDKKKGMKCHFETCPEKQ
jgi:hypothetical protein